MRISDWSSDVCSSDLVVMRLELLADGVALALDRLAAGRIDGNDSGDLPLDGAHRRRARIEVAAFAGAEFRVVGIGEKARRLLARVAQPNQLPAFLFIDEIP